MDKIKFPYRSAVMLLIWFWGMSSTVHGAAANPALLKAKQEAETKGFLFETSHDEIVEKAKKEGGQLRVLSGFDQQVFPHIVRSFKQRYPFIEVYVQEITGSDAGQRFILQMQSGGVKDWDVVHLNTDFFNDFPPYMKRFDIWAMSEQGILAIPSQMIDAKNHNIVALGTAFQVVAYNKKLLDPAKVPNTWEEFLRPEFKGKKFLVDIRPWGFASLVPLMGEEWVRDYSKRLAAQEPIWARGFTRVLTSMLAGEYGLHSGVNYHSIMRILQKDQTGFLVPKIVEPVPVRLIEPVAVINTAPRPYSALLWIEHTASAEAQKIIDKYEPLLGSVYARGSASETALRGKKLSVVDWDGFAKMTQWIEIIVKAFGFPKAEKR